MWVHYHCLRLDHQPVAKNEKKKTVDSDSERLNKAVSIFGGEEE